MTLIKHSMYLFIWCCVLWQFLMSMIPPILSAKLKTVLYIAVPCILLKISAWIVTIDSAFYFLNKTVNEATNLP